MSVPSMAWLAGIATSRERYRSDVGMPQQSRPLLVLEMPDPFDAKAFRIERNLAGDGMCQ